MGRGVAFGVVLVLLVVLAPGAQARHLTDPADDIPVLTAEPSYAVPGKNVTITLAASNLGDVMSGQIFNTLHAPEGATYVSTASATGGYSCTPRTDPSILDCRSGPVPGHSSWSIGLVFRIAAGVADRSALTWTVSLEDFNGDNPDNNRSSLTVTSYVQSDVYVSQSVSTGTDPVLAGTSSVLHLSVGNRGPARAEGIVLHDRLPSVFEVTSIRQTDGPATTCSNVSGQLTCPVGGLDAGATAGFDVTLKPLRSAPAEADTNVLSADTTSIDTTPEDRQASAVMRIDASRFRWSTLSVPRGSLTPGQTTNQIAFEIDNDGPSSGRNVEIGWRTYEGAYPKAVDVLDASFGDPRQGTCTTTGCVVPSFPSHGGVWVFLKVRIPPASYWGNPLNFSMTATADNADGRSQATLGDIPIAAPSADLVASVTHLSRTSYVVTVENDGPSSAEGVTLTSTVPARVTIRNVDNARCHADRTVVCAFGWLAPGETRTAHVTFDTTLKAGRLITVRASVRSYNEDAKPSNNSDSASLRR